MTYINRDVRLIRPAIQIANFQRFLRLLAVRAGQLLNISEIAKEMGLSQPTIKEWLEILEATYVIRLLRPYFSNRTKRFVKSPKVYFVDTGILSYLLGIRSEEQLASSPFVGHIFENMVIMEVLKRISILAPRPELYFYRSVGGVEIDLIVDWGLEKEIYEIKWSKEPNPHHIDSLKKVAAELKPKKAALLTLAEPSYRLTELVHAQHWSQVLS
jgi:predicted AAA+ superfamily ATPase